MFTAKPTIPAALLTSRPKRAAFTLIELLVVIAIIAILTAILFPVFAQAREKARQTACLANMKQIGLGIMMYSQDYDDTLVPAYMFALPGNTVVANWRTLIYPYVKNVQVFGCPSNPLSDKIANDSNTALMPSPLFPASYAANTTQNGTLVGATGRAPMNRVGGSSFNSTPHECLSLAMFAETSSTFLISEIGDDGSAAPGHAEINFNNGSPTAQRPLFGHQTMPNWIFADGHAKAMKATATITGKNMWNIDPSVAVPSGATPSLGQYITYQQARLDKK